MNAGSRGPGAGPVPVLMYHAVGDGALCSADPHYTVDWRRFMRQLNLLRFWQLRAASVRSLLDGVPREGRVAFTFDDGHETNAAAADALAVCHGTADFFVNPATVGHAGFLGWHELRAMARAGHSIQSHGLTHRYLDELSEAEVARELRESRARIEDAIGAPVTLFAPPGGRLTPVALRLAREAGYEAVCGSRAGLWRDAASHGTIPRLAVTASVDEARFERWLRQDGLEIARLRTRDTALRMAKRVLGNRRYDRMREAILRLPAARTPEAH